MFDKITQTLAGDTPIEPRLVVDPGGQCDAPILSRRSLGGGERGGCASGIKRRCAEPAVFAVAHDSGDAADA